ncbi:MAG: LLM class F420-dependent oxidoreductase, partial [Actinomycetota bacterium]
MKLGLMLGYWSAQPPPRMVELAQIAEGSGFDSVWTAEAYGSDVVSPLCWIGAHTSTIKLGTGLMQISARTPASAAMTAATIDHLSNGRLILGLGVSGPQVVEGWYGQSFPKPLARTREYVEIIRKILRREAPVVNEGEHYPMPYPGGTGLGKPLKITVHPLRSEIPIYLGAEGPKNVKMATEIADGWLPIFYSPYRNDMYEGISFRDGFEVACPVTVVPTDDVESALGFIKLSLSFYIGGMGAKDRNFHL